MLIEAAPLYRLLQNIDAIETRMAAADAEWDALDKDAQLAAGEAAHRQEVAERAALSKLKDELLDALRAALKESGFD